MSDGHAAPPLDHPGTRLGVGLVAERAGWYELVRLVHSLTPDECLEPGYYTDPAWTIRDLVVDE